MGTQERIESLTLDQLKACASSLFGKEDKENTFDSIVAEIEFRIGADECAAWIDETF